MTKDCPDGSKKDGGFVLPEIVSLYCQFGTSRREIQIFDIVLPFEASRGIRSKKLLNAVQSRIKFCIVWGQFYICPRPKYKFQIWRCQMEMAVFFDAVWARLGESLAMNRPRNWGSRFTGTRKQKETKQQPGTARPGNIHGCCLVSLNFLWDIHSVVSNCVRNISRTLKVTKPRTSVGRLSQKSWPRRCDQGENLLIHE